MGVTFDPAVATALTTIALAVFTGVYVVLTHRMLREMKLNREPAVFLDIEVGDNGELIVLVGNSGLSPARDIQFEVDDQLPWLEEGSSGLRILPAFKNGIAYLAPGRTLRFRVGFIDWKYTAKNRGWLYVRISYHTEVKGKVDNWVKIDLSRYDGISTDTFPSPDVAVAHTLQKMLIIQEMRRMEEQTQPVGMFQFCPMCLRTIPRFAKKCSECGEWLDKPEAGGAEELKE